MYIRYRFRWLGTLRHRSAAPYVLGSRIRFRWGHEYLSLLSVVCSPGSGLCNELITRSEDLTRVCVCVSMRMCDLET